MAETCLEDEIDEEELQLQYEEACSEVKDLQNELRASVIEAQQLGVRLQAAAQQAGASRASPAAMPIAGTAPGEDQRMADLRNLIEWLATVVNLEQTHLLDVGFEVPIGGRAIQLRRVMQWPLTSAPGGNLRLSAPIEHHAEIVGILQATKMQGGKVDPERLRNFAAAWDLVVGEFTTATHSQAEPSVLLAHRGSPLGILIATWPTHEALQAFHAMQAGNQQTTPAPVQAPGAPQQYVVHLGDRVEVEFEGKWYTGTLHSADADGKASVMCDTDAPGVLTYVHLSSVRPISASAPTGHAPVPSSNRQRFLSEECQAKADVVGTESCGRAGLSTKKSSAGHRRTQSSAL